MELRRELVLTIGALVVFNLVISLGAIGLLTRMSPAIERIIDENVRSIQATEEMLLVIAEAAGQPAPDEARERFHVALDRARTNITERDEAPLIASIDENVSAALDGDRASIAVVIGSLRALAGVNREAMDEADRGAKQLGTGGAWAAVFIAVFSFLVSLNILRRSQHRILTPLVELHSVLTATRAGEHHRRCRGSDAPIEIRQVLHAVNLLLDTRAGGSVDAEERRAQKARGERAALMHFLQRQAEPMVVITTRGDLIAANERAIELMSGRDGDALTRALARVAQGEDVSSIAAQALPGDASLLCVLGPATTARDA